MPNMLRISQRMLTKLFWENMLSFGDERGDEKASLLNRLGALDDLRAKADYNTGSISFAAAWCLYSLVRYFGFRRVIEVGTFIGKSSTAILAAMDANDLPGELFTCDLSNDLQIPWDGRSRLAQFPRTTSGDMFAQLTDSFDFVFLDGRLSEADAKLLAQRVTKDSVIALDDFEGFEKGVANYSFLSRLPQFQSHFLLYPADEELLKRSGFTSHSLTAVLLPISLISLAKQA